jgi:hypothetical protein
VETRNIKETGEKQRKTYEINKTTKKTWTDNKPTGDHYVKNIQNRATPINTPQHNES